MISIFDAKRKVLIWESAGQGIMDDNPDSREEGVPKAVAQIMKDYPVKPTQ